MLSREASRSCVCSVIGAEDGVCQSNQACGVLYMDEWYGTNRLCGLLAIPIAESNSAARNPDLSFVHGPYMVN